MENTKVKDIMESEPVMVMPDDTLQKAALMMLQYDCGILPVGTDHNVQGVITDRDIVIRAVSAGKNPATEKVRDYMSRDVHTCWETDSVKHAAELMNQKNVSRLLVKDSSGGYRGILSFGRILRKDKDKRELSEVVACATGRNLGPRISARI